MNEHDVKLLAKLLLSLPPDWREKKLSTLSKEAKQICEELGLDWDEFLQELPDQK